MRGQEFTGVHCSTYLPFVGISNQPAELTRHDAKWNINLLTGNIGLQRDLSFISSNFWDVITNTSFKDLKYFLGTEESLLYIKGRLMVPSISYKHNEKHSFGFSINVRSDGVYNSSNDDFIKIFQGIDNPEALANIKDEYFRSLVNSWVEYSLIWSATIVKTENSWLTGGLVVKLLNGSGSGYLEMDGIDVFFDKEYISHFDMRLNYGFNESFSKTIDGGDIVEQSGDIGVGYDLGLSYSFIPDHLVGVEGVPYKYKIGLVVADVGKIRHIAIDNKASYNVQMNNVPYSRFKGVGSIEALKDSIAKSIEIHEIKGGSFKTNLPLTIGVNLDYCVWPKWFVNSTISIRPNYYNSLVKFANKNIWRGNLTVRYETKKIGVYVPITYSNVVGWGMGVSARYGNFFIGSSTMIGNFFKKENSQQTLFLGMSIPIGALEE